MLCAYHVRYRCDMVYDVLDAVNAQGQFGRFERRLCTVVVAAEYSTVEISHLA